MMITPRNHEPNKSPEPTQHFVATTENMRTLMFKKCWVAQLFLVRPMKPSPFEIVLSLAGSVFMLLIVFHKPLGFSDDCQWRMSIALAACWIPLVILQLRG